MVPKNHHAYGMTLIRMIYNMVSKLGERHPVTLRGNKSTKWHDDTSRNTLIAKSLAPSKIDFPKPSGIWCMYLGMPKFTSQLEYDRLLLCLDNFEINIRIES